jgi:uncharacterized protein
MEYPDYYIDYLYCFNVLRDFFECHEYGEHLWLDSGRPPFLKGLIQVAVSLYHLENGNLRGSRMLWKTGRQYLAPYRPQTWGIDISQVFADMDGLHAQLPNVDRAKPDEVASWNLPNVFIRIVDPELQRILAAWSLSSLEEEKG